TGRRCSEKRGSGAAQQSEPASRLIRVAIGVRRETKQKNLAADTAKTRLSPYLMTGDLLPAERLPKPILSCKPGRPRLMNPQYINPAATRLQRGAAGLGARSHFLPAPA